MIKYKPFSKRAANKFLDLSENESYNELNEKMSISFEVDDETDKIVDVINKIIKDKNNLKFCETWENGSVNRYIINEDNVDYIPIEIFGCSGEIRIGDILEFTGGLNYYNSSQDQDANNYFTNKHGHVMNIEIKFKEKEKIIDEDGKNEVITELYFIINANLIICKNKLSLSTVSTLSHELRHGYIISKVYNGQPKFTTDERLAASKKWGKTYHAALFLLDNEKQLNYSKYSSDKFNRMFFDVIYSIYSSDSTEIAAFTQQAFEMCAECKTQREVDQILKKSYLNKTIELFDYVIYVMTNFKSFAQFYEQIRKKDINASRLPTVSQLIKHLTKRYKKALNNYGKVKMLAYEMVDYNNDVFYTDIKF